MTTNIKPLKNYWLCVNKNTGHIMPSTLSSTRRDCKNSALKGAGMDWNYGWECIKVNVTFEISSK